MRNAGIVAVLIGAVFLAAPRAREVELRVAARPVPQAAHRLGVNLGSWTSWGAEQLSANVLKNPGFEGVIDGAIVIVQASGDGWFLDDTPWLARPEGFWDGGSFSVRSGALAGRNGTVLHSSTHQVARFDVDQSLVGLRPGDAVALRVAQPPVLPTQWWFSGRKGSIAAEPGRRPGGEGGTVVRMSGGANAASVSSFLDTIGDRAGILLPINGEWSLSIWVRSDGPSVPFRVWFQRQGSAPFLSQTSYAGVNWEEHTWRFRVDDRGAAGSLELRFEVDQPETSVWLDDAALTRLPGGATPFRREVETALALMHPGYLRDWQGQAGDTLRNRLAPAWARQPYRYRPGGDEATDYGYSLPDFLTLCEYIGAQPWVVLPTTLNDDEWVQAGAYLAEQADLRHFREVLVEFGDENWNQVFRPAGIPNSSTLRATASRAFRLLLSGARQDKRLLPVLGGNYYDAKQLRAIAGATPHPWATGIAPYWAFDLQPGKGPGQLFADAGDLPAAVAASDNSVIYEMNASSLGAKLSVSEANAIVTSSAAGAALAWQSLRAMSAGVTRLCAWSLAGFDTFGEGGRLVRLFGLMRDLADGKWMRPTGVALGMVNRVVEGNQYPVESSSEDIQAIAFRSAEGWRAVICSRSARAERVHLLFPAFASLPLSAIALGDASPLANNEVVPQVHEREIPMTATASGIDFEIPAYGLVALLPARGQ